MNGLKNLENGQVCLLVGYKESTISNGQSTNENRHYKQISKENINISDYIE